MAEYLMETKNGMLVWVPEEKLEAFAAAQNQQTQPLTPEVRELSSRISSRIEAYLSKAHGRSE